MKKAAMKMITAGFAVMFMMLCSSVTGFAQTAQFDGLWKNVDPLTRGITTLKIDVTGATVKVRAFGKCHPTDCDWGVEGAYAYSPNVSSNPIISARALTVFYDQGFAERILVIRRIAGTLLLRADVYTHFKDHSGRSDYNDTYIFREVAGIDGAVAAPEQADANDEQPDGQARAMVMDNKEVARPTKRN